MGHGQRYSWFALGFPSCDLQDFEEITREITPRSGAEIVRSVGHSWSAEACSGRGTGRRRHLPSLQRMAEAVGETRDISDFMFPVQRRIAVRSPLR